MTHPILTPEETATLHRAVASAAAGVDTTAEYTAALVSICERLVSAVEYRQADADEARAELARRLAPIDNRSALPPETLRGWRFSAEAAQALIAQGRVDLDTRSLLECFLLSIGEIERLCTVLDQRDNAAVHLSDVLPLPALTPEQRRQWRTDAGNALAVRREQNPGTMIGQSDVFDRRPEPAATETLKTLLACLDDLDRSADLLSAQAHSLTALETRLQQIEATLRARDIAAPGESVEPPAPPISDAFNSDDTPPDFRAPPPEAEADALEWVKIGETTHPLPDLPR